MTNDTNSSKVSDFLYLVSESAAMAAALYLAYKAVVTPDTQRRIRMGIARSVARYSTAQETFWGNLARNANTYYWQTANA